MEHIVICTECGKSFSLSSSAVSSRSRRGTSLKLCSSCLRKAEYKSGKKARNSLSFDEVKQRIPSGARPYFRGTTNYISPSGNKATKIVFLCPICHEEYTIGFSNLTRRHQYACPSCSGYKFSDKKVRAMVPPRYKRYLLKREYLADKGHTLYWFTCSSCKGIFNVQDSALFKRKASRCLCPLCMQSYYGKYIIQKNPVLTIRDNFRRSSAIYWHKFGVNSRGRDAHHIVPYSLCIRNGDPDFAMSPLNCVYLCRDEHHQVHFQTASSPFLKKLSFILGMNYLKAKALVLSPRFQSALLSYQTGV